MNFHDLTSCADLLMFLNERNDFVGVFERGNFDRTGLTNFMIEFI